MSSTRRKHYRAGKKEYECSPRMVITIHKKHKLKLITTISLVLVVIFIKGILLGLLAARD